MEDVGKYWQGDRLGAAARARTTRSGRIVPVSAGKHNHWLPDAPIAGADGRMAFAGPDPPIIQARTDMTADTASVVHAAARQTARQLTGAAGEKRALAYLQDHGLVLVECNFRCKTGEIDLIMRDGATLVFVEVRARADMRHGGAAASVTPAKQRRLIRAAQRYLQRFRMPPACRIDVIAIDAGDLTWLKNAITG